MVAGAIGYYQVGKYQRWYLCTWRDRDGRALGLIIKIRHTRVLSRHPLFSPAVTWVSVAWLGFIRGVERRGYASVSLLDGLGGSQGCFFTTSPRLPRSSHHRKAFPLRLLRLGTGWWWSWCHASWTKTHNDSSTTRIITQHTCWYSEIISFSSTSASLNIPMVMPSPCAGGLLVLVRFATFLLAPLRTGSAGAAADRAPPPRATVTTLCPVAVTTLTD